MWQRQEMLVAIKDIRSGYFKTFGELFNVKQVPIRNKKDTQKSTVKKATIVIFSFPNGQTAIK